MRARSRIPAAKFGPRGKRWSIRSEQVEVEEIHRAACVYALTALSLCNREARYPHVRPGLATSQVLGWIGIAVARDTDVKTVGQPPMSRACWSLTRGT